MPNLVHPLIQTARGALADEDYAETERLLAQAVEAAKGLEEERGRLHDALCEIAVVRWPDYRRIAREALRDGRPMRPDAEGIYPDCSPRCDVRGGAIHADDCPHRADAADGRFRGISVPAEAWTRCFGHVTHDENGHPLPDTSGIRLRHEPIGELDDELPVDSEK